MYPHSCTSYKEPSDAKLYIVATTQFELTWYTIQACILMSKPIFNIYFMLLISDKRTINYTNIHWTIFFWKSIINIKKIAQN